MIEQVYQTDDGSIFPTREQAEQYENFTVKRDSVANLIYKESRLTINFDEAKEIATVVMNFYKVEKL